MAETGAVHTDGQNGRAAGQPADPPIIETRDVSKHFSAGRAGAGRGKATLKAVDGVSLSIRRGETLALVGETGSGKTTFGRLLLGLYQPTSGDILYQGRSILDRSGGTAILAVCVHGACLSHRPPLLAGPCRALRRRTSRWICPAKRG